MSMASGNIVTSDRSARLAFPLGAALTVVELHADPYPAYARLRAAEPISWVPAFNMWFVTRADLVREILMDDRNFTTESPHSVIGGTFGANMLSVDGPLHNHYRRPMQHAFLPAHVRRVLEPAIEMLVAALVDGFADAREVELRTALASRLPVQTILLTFGLPITDEPLFRAWYDDFERALANFTGDTHIRSRAAASVASFHAYLDDRIAEHRREGGTETLLGSVVNAPADRRLALDEIKRNLAIIFFGGISTVEALILNSVWALAHHPATRARVRDNFALISATLDETMRWLSPVQSATRHAVGEVRFQGVTFANGETVNCMLGGANHDPALFAEPGRFDIARANVAQHLGFATGPHMCLGFRLAKAEAGAALRHLLKIAPDLAIVAERSTPPEGYEFRQPRRLTLAIGA